MSEETKKPMITSQFDANREMVTRGVVATDKNGREYSVDIFTRLLQDRIINIAGPITSEGFMDELLKAQMLFLDSEDNKKPITVYVNSPGGSVIAGLGIYDTMQYVQAPVHTICTGLAASMGSVLLMAGADGARAAYENSTIMTHQLSGGTRGQFDEMQTGHEFSTSLMLQLAGLYAKHTGLSVPDVLKYVIGNDNYMSPAQAKEFGLIDEIVKPRKIFVAPTRAVPAWAEPQTLPKTLRSLVGPTNG